MSTIQDIAFQKMGGTTATLADYQGKVALIVNVASKCGLTPQYEDLEKLYRLKKAEGLEIIGFPANNFWNKSLVVIQRFKISVQSLMM